MGRIPQRVVRDLVPEIKNMKSARRGKGEAESHTAEVMAETDYI